MAGAALRRLVRERAGDRCEWCGVRNGRVRVNSPLAISPATEWTMEVSSSSAGDTMVKSAVSRWETFNRPRSRDAAAGTSALERICR